MKKVTLHVAYSKNRPVDAYKGLVWNTRVWRNELTLTESELRADFERPSDGLRGPSLSEAEVRDIYYGCQLALRLMRKHRVRQLWRRILFR
jgi:hypothetical protein